MVEIQNANVIDIVTTIGQHVIHKQIEQRDGMMFLRIKKRRLLGDY